MGCRSQAPRGSVLGRGGAELRAAIPPLAPCAVLTVCSAVVPPLTVRSAVVPLIPHTPPGESSVFGWDGVSSSLKMPLPGTVRPGHVSLSQGRVCGRAVGASDSKGSG